MKEKTVKLEETTRILLNKAKSKYLQKNLKVFKCTDNQVINQALKEYIGGKK